MFFCFFIYLQSGASVSLLVYITIAIAPNAIAANQIVARQITYLLSSQCRLYRSDPRSIVSTAANPPSNINSECLKSVNFDRKCGACQCVGVNIGGVVLSVVAKSSRIKSSLQ